MDIITSFYKFVYLADPDALRMQLKALSVDLDLKGTILLAQEGINAMVAGSPEHIAAFKAYMTATAEFADLEFKDTIYHDVSFRRMLVKVKKEIITMRQSVDPREETGQYLDPLVFRQWQDEGKEMLVLDTRNDYEVALGTFKNAVDPKIKSFGEFPAWVDDKLGELDPEAPVVTFCTGGIRCEKATAYMKKKGFKHVYQLRGGILKYFEETLQAGGDEHWQGDCIVFDKRKAITKTLTPSTEELCYVCLVKLEASNKAPQPGPAGELCQTCAEQMEVHQKRRLMRGDDIHQKNLQRREAFLRERRKAFAAKAQDEAISAAGAPNTAVSREEASLS